MLSQSNNNIATSGTSSTTPPGSIQESKVSLAPNDSSANSQKKPSHSKRRQHQDRTKPATPTRSTATKQNPDMQKMKPPISSTLSSVSIQKSNVSLAPNDSSANSQKKQSHSKRRRHQHRTKSATPTESIVIKQNSDMQNTEASVISMIPSVSIQERKESEISFIENDNTLFLRELEDTATEFSARALSQSEEKSIEAELCSKTLMLLKDNNNKDEKKSGDDLSNTLFTSKNPDLNHDARVKDQKKNNIIDCIIPASIFQPVGIKGDLFKAIVTLNASQVASLLAFIKRNNWTQPFSINILSCTYSKTTLDHFNTFLIGKDPHKLRRAIAQELVNAGALAKNYDDFSEYNSFLNAELFSDVGLISKIIEDNDLELFRIIFLTLPEIAFRIQLDKLKAEPFLLARELTALLDEGKKLTNREVKTHLKTNLSFAMWQIGKILGNDSTVMNQICELTKLPAPTTGNLNAFFVNSSNGACNERSLTAGESRADASLSDYNKRGGVSHTLT